VAGALFASTGRHVGFLSLLAEDPDRPSRADRQVLAAVTRVIADHLDRTQEIAALARIVGTAEAGVVLTRGEDDLPLPGLPDDRLLAPASPILDAARDELSAGGPYTAFLAPVAGPDGERLVRVTALDCAVPDLDHLSAAVLLSSPGDLRGLTPLDLRALGTWWPVRRRSPRSPRHSTSTRAPRPRPSAAPRSPWTPPASPPLPRGRSARGCASPGVGPLGTYRSPLSGRGGPPPAGEDLPWSRGSPREAARGRAECRAAVLTLRRSAVRTPAPPATASQGWTAVRKWSWSPDRPRPRRTTRSG